MADSGTNYDDVGMDISEDSGDNGEGEASSTNERASKSNNNCDKYVSKRETAAMSFDLEKKNLLGESKGGGNEKKEYVERGKGRSGSEEKLSKDKDEKHSNSRSKRDRSRERNSKEKYISNRSVRESSRESRDHKDSRKSLDYNKDYRRSSRDDRRSVRKSRSRSRDRKRSRSHSRSHSPRERRRRRTRSRSRDRDKERRRPHEIRKEAQQKLAAFKASNPNFDHNEMLKRGMEAQVAEVQKNTGVTLPSYYNPATMNPLKIAEQERKKKLLWGNKSKVDPVAKEPIPGSGELWSHTKFSNDSDGKMAEKFKRLMGVKATGPSTSTPQSPDSADLKDSVDILQKQETLFSSMEKQYEMARLATHTHKGFGLGFSSQPYLPKQ